MDNCKLCVHKPVCDLWRSNECQDASCFSSTDEECDFFMEGWIPVSEKRPNGECLAISMLPGPAYKEMLVGWIGKVEEWENGYICESDGVILPNVTHWMQPEPPKEDAT